MLILSIALNKIKRERKKKKTNKRKQAQVLEVYTFDR